LTIRGNRIALNCSWQFLPLMSQLSDVRQQNDAIQNGDPEVGAALSD
jgi:hypothetical protein